MRRRGLMEAAVPSPYPFVSDFPELTEFGTFLLSFVSASGSGSTNTFLRSGTTNYQYCGGESRSCAWYRIKITDSAITVTRASSSGTWISKAFAGFPVKFKRCSGSAGSAPLVTVEVTKEE